MAGEHEIQTEIGECSQIRVAHGMHLPQVSEPIGSIVAKVAWFQVLRETKKSPAGRETSATGQFVGGRTIGNRRLINAIAASGAASRYKPFMSSGSELTPCNCPIAAKIRRQVDSPSTSPIERKSSARIAARDAARRPRL